MSRGACGLRPKSRARRIRAPCLPAGFSLLVGFSGASILVSILTWSMIGICGRFCGPEGVVGSMIGICGRFCGPGGGVLNGFCGNYGSLLAWDGPFQAVGLSFW